MFDIFKDMKKLQDRVTLRKLTKRNDVDSEVEIQTRYIMAQNDRIIEVTKKGNEKLIIYQRMHGIPEFDKRSLDIHLRVITSKGVITPDPQLYASYRDNYIHIIDIKIFGKNQNKGYGTILLNKVVEIALSKNINRITGQISQEDNDHLDRLVHFYKKNGFRVDLDNCAIEWINNNSDMQ